MRSPNRAIAPPDQPTPPDTPWAIVLFGLLIVLMPDVMMPSSAHGARDATPPLPAGYLVFEIAPDGAVQSVFSAPVELRSPPYDRVPRTPARSTRNDIPVLVRLHDDAGALVFEETLHLPRWLRSESPGAALGDGTFAIESHAVPASTHAFVVRVPIVPGARLSLQSELMRQPTAFGLDALTRAARSAGPSLDAATPVVRNGDPGNRLDLLVVGEGYTSAERSKFEADAASLTNGFFDLTPLQEYGNYVNVSTLFVPSNQSGADQPGYDAACNDSAPVQSCCSDTTAFGLTPVTVDTAFDATFCSFDVQRALVVDDAKVFTAAAAEPDWDLIIVLVNTSTDGGTGGAGVTVLSTTDFVANVAQHEHGHTFGLLADEYDEPFPGYPDCSDVVSGLPECEPNVTDRTSRALIKWGRWIDVGQPIPSFDPPTIATAAGLWQGARYVSTGKYRQGYSCLMRFLGEPYCDVAAEAITIRFYQGGWGAPADGIDNIEPGTESPPAGTVNLAETGGTFSAAVLGPQSGPDLKTEWFVDANLVVTAAVANGGRAAFTLDTTPGAHTLELRVTDMSPVIHETIRGSFTSMRFWNVTVGPTACGDADANGAVTVTDGVQTLRAAAGLSSPCTLARCDVNGSGAITVTDGVQVLRGAAGLPLLGNCQAEN